MKSFDELGEEIGVNFTSREKQIYEAVSVSIDRLVGVVRRSDDDLRAVFLAICDCAGVVIASAKRDVGSAAAAECRQWLEAVAADAATSAAP